MHAGVLKNYVSWQINNFLITHIETKGEPSFDFESF